MPCSSLEAVSSAVWVVWELWPVALDPSRVSFLRLRHLVCRPTADGRSLLVDVSQEVDPQFEPVHKLTEQVAVSTGEEGDNVIFKM